MLTPALHPVGSRAKRHQHPMTPAQPPPPQVRRGSCRVVQCRYGGLLRHKCTSSAASLMLYALDPCLPPESRMTAARSLSLCSRAVYCTTTT